MKLRRNYVIIAIASICFFFLYISVNVIHSVNEGSRPAVSSTSLRGPGDSYPASDSEMQRQLKELNSTLVAMNRLILKALSSVEAEADPPAPAKIYTAPSIQPAAGAVTSTSLTSSVNVAQSRPLADVAAPKTALIFTMDSISTYELDSQRGGAAGEILVRRCLEGALQELGVAVTVARSDAAFDATNGCAFDFIIMDPWTWAGPGWVPKVNIRNCMSRMYILDFFGTRELHRALSVPPSRVLTAFGSPWNTFLGFYKDEPSEADVTAIAMKKRAQGVIWGKDPKHFKGREEMLRRIAESVQLISTCQQRQTFSGAAKITWRGHQTASSWLSLLQESRFLLGLGDPLLGPSAIDAVAAGAMYINPIYDAPVRDIHHSQHDFAEKEIGFPQVCSVKLSNISGVMRCIDYAMNNPITPVVPLKLTKDAYMQRVKQIFEL